MVIHPFNWKITREADFASDQATLLDSTFQGVFENSGDTEIFDQISVWSGKIRKKPSASDWTIRNYQKLLPGFEHLPKSFQRTSFHIAVFPYLTFSLYPDCVKFMMTLPISSEKTRLVSGFYAPEDHRREVKAVRYLTGRLNARFKQHRDNYAEKLQQGLDYRKVSPIMLETSGSSIQNFYQQIQNELPVTRFIEEPDPGTISYLNKLLLDAEFEENDSKNDSLL